MSTNNKRRASGPLSPPSTEKRAKTGSGSDERPRLVGQRLKVPGQVFKMPDEVYWATVIRPTKGNHRDRVDVRFDDDKLLYWFSVSDVKKWAKAYDSDPNRKVPRSSASTPQQKAPTSSKASHRRDSSAQAGSGPADSAQAGSVAGSKCPEGRDGITTQRSVSDKTPSGGAAELAEQGAKKREARRLARAAPSPAEHPAAEATDAGASHRVVESAPVLHPANSAPQAPKPQPATKSAAAKAIQQDVKLVTQGAELGIKAAAKSETQAVGKSAAPKPAAQQVKSEAKPVKAAAAIKPAVQQAEAKPAKAAATPKPAAQQAETESAKQAAAAPTPAAKQAEAKSAKAAAAAPKPAAKQAEATAGKQAAAAPTPAAQQAEASKRKAQQGAIKDGAQQPSSSKHQVFAVPPPPPRLTVADVVRQRAQMLTVHAWASLLFGSVVYVMLKVYNRIRAQQQQEQEDAETASQKAHDNASGHE